MASAVKSRSAGWRLFFVLPAFILLFLGFSTSETSGEEHWSGAAKPVTYTTTPTTSRSSLSPGTCTSTWQQVAAPGMPPGSNPTSLAVVSANDIWAVGDYNNGSVRQTLTFHWDGNTWATVPSPNVGSGNNTLAGTAALSSTDVWAVGGAGNQTLIENWNGTQWSVVPSLNVGTGLNYLADVTAISPTDVWAAGYYYNGSINQTLIEHWNGSTWNVVASPNYGNGYHTYLNGVAAVSANDIWAVGYAADTFGIYRYTYALHWTGSTWSVVGTPNPGFEQQYLVEVSATASNDVWSVGYYHPSSSPTWATLAIHWNGTGWSMTPSPNPSTYVNYLFGVSARASSDVWAVGYSGNSTYQPLIEHWDGSVWNVSTSPPITGVTSSLADVVPVSANEAWAVGSYATCYSPCPSLPIIEHYSDPCVTPSPTPTGTPTFTPIPTFTPTATSTPTPTATATDTSYLVGHVVWQGAPPQPDLRQMQPISLTLRSGGTPVATYGGLVTDGSGFFTVSVGSLVPDTYDWWAKGPRSLANAGQVILSGVRVTQAEMGLIRGGDANNDNNATLTDFTILRSTFGSTGDLRADFNNDGVVSTGDFTILKSNYGQGGAP